MEALVIASFVDISINGLAMISSNRNYGISGRNARYFQAQGWKINHRG